MLVARVLEFLDDCIRDLNTYPWESSKTSESYTLTANQQYVTVNTLFFKDSQAFLTSATQGNTAPLRSLPYIQFKRLYPETNVTTNLVGFPSIYTIFNYEKTRRMLFDVAPDTSTATNYTLVLEYYKRLPLISSVSGINSADIPDYFENTIVYGAFKRMCAHVGDAQGVSMYSSLEREALERLQRIDVMHPDADRRFRLIDEVPYNLSSVNGVIYPFC